MPDRETPPTREELVRFLRMQAQFWPLMPEFEAAASLLESGQRLLDFAVWATAHVREGMDVDGGELQDKAHELGLFVKVEATGPCGPLCNCAGYGEWPMICYRDSPLLAQARCAALSGPAEGGTP